MAMKESPPAAWTGLLHRALALLRQGQWAAAEAQCRQVLALRPTEPTTLQVLGACLLHQQRYADAEVALAACLQQQPGDASALANRGIALQGLGRLEEALACYAQSLAAVPAQPATLNMQALALLALRRFEEALASFDRAVAAAPDFAEAWCNRSHALIELRRYPPALESLDRALTLRPAYGEALANRAIVLNLLGRHAEALKAAQQAEALLPPQASVQRSLADALAGLQRFDEALRHCDRAVMLAADDVRPWIGRADVFSAIGRDQAAAADYAHALSLLDERLRRLQHDTAGTSDGQRRDLATAMHERGLLLVDMSRHREAIECFARAAALVEDFADAHWAEALNRLRLGDYEQGWRLYEWRQRMPAVGLGLRQFDAPCWLGDEDPAGLRILLHAEQGFGDTMQFCRYAPLLAARGAQVTLLAPPALRSLLRSLPAVEIVGDGDPLPPFDRHCPLLSLPYAFRTSLATVPANVPYLHAGTQRVDRWREVVGRAGKLRVGLVWSGNPRHAKDRERSMPLATVAPLFDLDVQFVSLVKELRERDRDLLQRLPLKALGETVADFADTAALIACLDLVITVDTAVAHLAGALGKRVWILLDARPDFRWLLDRDDTPWYPTAKLFRQQRPGHWSGVIDRVGATLQAQLRGAKDIPTPSAG